MGKLVDFGLARRHAHDCRTFCGTPQYFAPEVITTFSDQNLDGGYGREVDLWSLGVILYVMLSGVTPFEEDESGGLYKQILEGKFEFGVLEWTTVSPEAKELVQKLMTVNPRERLTVQQALEHPWLRLETQTPCCASSSAVSGGAAYRNQGGGFDFTVKRRRTSQ